MGKQFVVDSSAVLAVLQSEPGSDRVEARFEESIISAVNLAEVLTKLTEKSVDSRVALNFFLQVGLEIADFDVAQSLETAALRPLTKHLGLSLGDRACLSLAIREQAVALTTDTKWKDLDVCRVELIR